MQTKSNVDYVKHLARLWKGQTSSPGGFSLQDYLKELARRGMDLPARAKADAEGLELFRRHVIDRAEHLRWRMLGANVQRRAKLIPVQRHALQVLDIEPDLLEPMRESRYEPIHTKLLAYHLDPSKGSELAPMLLTAFLALVAEGSKQLGLAEPSFMPGSPVLVEAERVTTEGRVDLSITLEDTLMLVENKIDSTEGPSQLERYDRALGKLRKPSQQGLLVYLTLPEAEPPKSNVPFVPLTFRDVLRAWLPFASPDGGAAGYLARYLKSIASHLLGLSGRGSFDDWGFSEQRSVLELVEEISGV